MVVVGGKVLVLIRLWIDASFSPFSVIFDTRVPVAVCLFCFRLIVILR